MSARLSLVVVLLACDVKYPLHFGVEGRVITRTTTESPGHHNTIVNIRNNDKGYRYSGSNSTVEIGPLVWSYERRAWVDANPPATSTMAPDIKNIIVAPDLRCDVGEIQDANGVCREDWGRMAAPVNSTTTTSTPDVRNCPEGQVRNPQGHCKEQRGRTVPEVEDRTHRGHQCPQGQFVDDQGHCRDQRGRTVPEVEDRTHRGHQCPQGQFVDDQGHCRDQRGRNVPEVEDRTHRGHQCPQGQFADDQGHCRDQRGRTVPEVEDRTHRGHQCPQGQFVDDPGHCRDQRGRTVETPRQDRPRPVGITRTMLGGVIPRSCPSGQVMDHLGQCREDWERRRRRFVGMEE